MDCSAEKAINTHEILGAWYFSMGSESIWKMELKADGNFSIAVFSEGRHVESESTGGEWSLKDEILILKWRDGTVRKDKVSEITDCSLSTTSLDGEINGHYYRKPVPARPCHNKAEQEGTP